MRLCIIDANNICINVIDAKSEDTLLLPVNTSYASDHTGEIGWIFKNGSWVDPTPLPPPPTDEELAAQIRAKRNGLLAATDWTQVADALVDQAAWATYRQALRDITKQPGFPHDVVWPEKPENTQ